MDTPKPPADNPVQLGDQLYSQGDFEGARNAYQRATTDTPANATAWKALGLTFIAQKQFAEAIRATKTAANLQPGNSEIRYVHGYALGASGRYSEAVNELDAALELQPNNIAAKQALVYSLLQVGIQSFRDDPYVAEKYFDRAHKLEQKNPQIVSQLLDLYLFMGQKGKAVQLVRSLDDGVKHDPLVQEALNKMESNPDFKVALHQAAVQQRAAQSAPQIAKPTQKSIQQVLCPNCRNPIMDYAAICPHCNFQLRQYGTFAGRDTGPDHTWQEVTYVILSVIWCLVSCLDIFLGLQLRDEGIKAFEVTVGVVNLGVGIGLICRTEWLMFLAKIFCYLNLLRCTVFMMIGFFVGPLIGGFINLAELALYGLMVYLISYEGG